MCIRDRVGTGAYKVDGYEPDSRMTLSINDGWWGKRPYIEKIVANAVSGSDQKIEKVESSILDFITTDVLYACLLYTSIRTND